MSDWPWLLFFNNKQHYNVSINVLDSTGSWPRCHVSWWLLKRVDQTRESCSSTSNCRPWPHQRLNRAGEEELKLTKLNLTDHPPLVTFLGTASETK